jgi:hypothetical protein
MSCATNCNAAAVSRNYIYNTSWDLRHRTGWNGLYGIHGSQHSEPFNSTFHTQVGYGFSILNSYSVLSGPGTIDWIGDIGVKVCKTGCHSTGRAMDLTAVRLGSTVYDMNVIWRSSESLANRRKYLAIWAALRRDCTTVLTAQYNTEHHNHIHVDIDDDTTPPPIRTSALSDTKLIQHTCNLINGASLTVDGAWGSLTSSAYASLLYKFKLQCKSPTTNYNDMRALVQLISRTAIANKTAGFYVATCTTPQ